jgi:uncharacterized RDD family membrane protein YckC/ankyrin repeat protein
MENKEEIVYAGFWVRVLASVIDGLVLAIPLTIVETLFGEDSTVTLILFVVVWWLYTSRMLSSSWKATIGKKIFAIEVLTEKGESLTFRGASFRFVSSMISYILIIPIFMLFFTEKKQTLHDKMAKTIVLDSAAMSDGSTYSNVKFIRVIGYIILAIIGTVQIYTIGLMIFFYLAFTAQDNNARNENSTLANSHAYSTVIERNEANIDEYIKKEKLRVNEEKEDKAKIKKENKKLMYKVRKILVHKDRSLIEIENLLKQSTNLNMAYEDTHKNLLYTAVERDDYNASKLLLEKGLSPKSSLSRALSNKTSIDLFNLLLRYYLKSSDNKKALDILYKGIYRKSVPKKIENILEYIVSINENSKTSTSVLGTAIKSCSSIETIKLLLDYGAKLNEDVKLVPLLRKSSYKCRYRKDIEEAMTPKRIIKPPVYKELIRMD